MVPGQKKDYTEKIPLSPIPYYDKTSDVMKDNLGPEGLLFTTESKSKSYICENKDNKDNNVYKSFDNSFNKENNLFESMLGGSEDENEKFYDNDNVYFINNNDNKTIANEKEEPKEKNIIFITEKIDNSNNKIELLRTKTKNARKSNNTKNVRKDNGFQTLCTACEEKINESIQTKIDNYLMEKNIKIDSKLYKPAITPLPCSIAKKVIFIEKPILKYYLKYTKQRLNEERAGLSNKYKNTKIISLLLHLEKEDAKREEKKFKMIFNTPFKDYLLAFVKDEQFMIKESQISLKFETLKDCFNNGKIRYNAKDKDNLKNYTIKLFNRNMKRKKK